MRREPAFTIPTLKRDELERSFVQQYFAPYLDTIKRVRSRTEYERNLLFVMSYFKWRRNEPYLFLDLTEEDAKEYFLGYLAKQIERGALSRDTFSVRLSACRSFSHFIVNRQSFLQEQGVVIKKPYEPAFDRIVRPAMPGPVREEKLVTEMELDSLLLQAKAYDTRLYMIYLLSLRMALKQREILSLKREHFDFFEDRGNFIGILKLIRNLGQVYLRIPADLLPELYAYVKDIEEGPIFRNNWNRPMTPSNLTDLRNAFVHASGISISLSQVRTRGMIDLVASNSNDLVQVSEYTGLSGQMIEGYGRALAYVQNSCVADNCHLQLLTKKEEKQEGSEE